MPPDFTCRTDSGSLIKNEVGTSRPCSEQSPRMSGDFGPSPIQIVSLLASDPTGLGSRYRAGNAITVSSPMAVATSSTTVRSATWLCV